MTAAEANERPDSVDLGVQRSLVAVLATIGLAALTGVISSLPALQKRPIAVLRGK